MHPASKSLVAARRLMLAGLILAAVSPAWSQDTPTEGAYFSTQPKVVVMSPFEVKVSVLGSIGVTFTLQGEDAKDPEAPIFWATVTDVPPGGPGQRAGLKSGDELIRLNGRLIRGLTVAQFAAAIQRESKRGDLIWNVRRGIAGISFTTIFNGKTKPGAGAFATYDQLPSAAAGGAEADGTNSATPAKIEKMAPFTVQASRGYAIEVRFILKGENLAVSIDDPIREANVVATQGEGAQLRGSLQAGDALVGLNGTPIKGLTLRQLGALAAQARAKGDLVWDVRRGLSTFTQRFNGRWIKPLPFPDPGARS